MPSFALIAGILLGETAKLMACLSCASCPKEKLRPSDANRFSASVIAEEVATLCLVNNQIPTSDSRHEDTVSSRTLALSGSNNHDDGKHKQLFW